MPSNHDTAADVAVGRHPDYGIVANVSNHRLLGDWTMKVLDFHPVPDQPSLYTLANQLQDGQARATRAVASLRQAGHGVDADAAFDPDLISRSTPAPGRAPGMEPDVAFADVPRLGIVAATAPLSEPAGHRVLQKHGWQLDPALDVYTLPASTERGEALEKVARATVAMHRSGLRVAVQPLLAAEAAARTPASPAPRRVGGRGITTAAALATSPARSTLGSTPPTSAAPSEPVSRPVDPRTAFSRNR
ncbi:hypothetical protein ACWC1D_32450 [Streptomyces sp. NPDC001478]